MCDDTPPTPASITEPDPPETSPVVSLGASSEHPLANEDYADVLDATRLFLLDSIPEHGFIDRWAVETGVMRQLGYDGPYHPGRRFQGRVQRAIERLSSDGEIVKVGNPTRLYTAETWEAAVAETQVKRERLASHEERWQRCSTLLRRHGFDHSGGTVGGESVLLSARLDDWERVAKLLAEHGNGAITV